MFPFLPESSADLVPLPLCEGPKLKPFAFQDQQNIEFLEYLGAGAHSYVWKVKMDGSIYALKMARDKDGIIHYMERKADGSTVQIRGRTPLYGHGRNTSPSFKQYWVDETIGPPPPEDLEALRFFYNYSEPFNAECRAFGRLQEAGHEEAALKCFGYVLLDETHECAFREQCGEKDNEGYPFYFEAFDENTMYRLYDIKFTTRYSFAGENGKLPPIRCIVKEFGHGIDDDDKAMQVRDASRILWDIKGLHQLGIFRLDFRLRQLINGKLAGLSVAVTTPHYLTNPEFNPRLTPGTVADMEFQVFALDNEDYRSFPPTTRAVSRRREKCWHLPCLPARIISGRPKHNLRSGKSPQPPYTLADPRRFDWKAAAVVLSRQRSQGGQAEKQT